jgi:hypothetical protein
VNNVGKLLYVIIALVSSVIGAMVGMIVGGLTLPAHMIHLLQSSDESPVVKDKL